MAEWQIRLLPRHLRMRRAVVVLLAALVLSVACRSASARSHFNVETNAIYVQEPAELRGDYEAAIGDFGVPLYGGELAGKLVAPQTNEKGCESFGSGSFYSEDPNVPTIALIDRGDCYFIEKAFHAQQAGAAAVVVVDDRVEPLITMSNPEDESSVRDLINEVTIPTVLVMKEFGEQLKEALRSRQNVLIELSWMESISHPDDRVEWEMWTTSNDACGPSCDQQASFKVNAARVAMQLEKKGYAKFTPHYKIRRCKPQNEDCDRSCIHNGRYCAVGHIDYPFNETFAEREIILENKRQVCMFDYLQKAEMPDMWWKYVAGYAENCKIEDGNFGDACSSRIMQGLNVPNTDDLLQSVRECMGNTREDKLHPLLELEIEAENDRFNAGHGRIVLLPTLVVNTEQYRGRLEMGSVLRAICSGFEETTEPAMCLQKGLQVNECDDDNACWKNPDPELSEEHSSSCLDTFRGHICTCPKGYIGDGYQCEEMNECTLGLDDCSQKCVNTPGGYMCECHPGFEKVGETQCVLRDSCAVDNGGCEQTCHSSAHGSTCSCKEGYNLSGDGRTCQDIDECKIGTDECDQICINTTPRESAGFKYVCGCEPGYTLDISDPMLRKCTSNENMLRKWGIEPKKHHAQATVLEIALMTVVSVVIVFCVGYAYYKWRLKRVWDKEIRSILSEYVPLDEKPDTNLLAEAMQKESQKRSGVDPVNVQT